MKSLSSKGWFQSLFSKWKWNAPKKEQYKMIFLCTTLELNTILCLINVNCRAKDNCQRFTRKILYFFPVITDYFFFRSFVNSLISCFFVAWIEWILFFSTRKVFKRKTIFRSFNQTNRIRKKVVGKRFW